MGTTGTCGYFKFAPELIVEVTMVCDRACTGCYSPNLVSRERAEIVQMRRPSLFLNPDVLRERLSDITFSTKRQLRSLTFRGGEPTRHPELPALVDLSLRFTRRLFVETHARWLLPGEDAGLDADAIMATLARRSVTLKISFDSMHETSAAELKELLERLDRRRVNWLIAITEPDDESIATCRASCVWVPDSKIVRQQKAVRASELNTPPLGVMRPDGTILRLLSTRRAF
jgi:hypothetical protein